MELARESSARLGDLMSPWDFPELSDTPHPLLLRQVRESRRKRIASGFRNFDQLTHECRKAHPCVCRLRFKGKSNASACAALLRRIQWRNFLRHRISDHPGRFRRKREFE